MTQVHKMYWERGKALARNFANAVLFAVTAITGYTALYWLTEIIRITR